MKLIIGSNLRFNISIFELLFGEVPSIPGTKMGDILVLINTIVLLVLGFLYLYQIVMSISSVFVRSKKYPETPKTPHYIFVSSARNEENVIAQLINSIRALDYPQEQITIHVIADNCTDKTKDIAASLGARVFVRENLEEIGKSYALDYYFKTMQGEKVPNDFAGYIVVDADNVFDDQYLNEINKVYAANNATLIAAYRNSSNMGDSLATFGTGYSFLRECTLMHKVRERLSLSSYVSGTSFFVSNEKIKTLGGWPFHALIEDIEFSVDHVATGGVTHYAHDAIFYDEQPKKMKASMTQRMRWVKGLYQVSYRHGLRMFKRIFSRNIKTKERFTAYEAFLFVTPFPVLGLLWFIIYGIFAGVNLYFMRDFNYFIQTYLFSLFDFMFGLYLFSTITALLITISDWRRIKMSGFKKIILPFLAFFFLITYMPLLFVAPFKKVTWKQIPHYGVKNKL